MEDDVKYQIWSSLLQFYSDRAISHASFLVASIFGLFTVLSLMTNASIELLSLIWLTLTCVYWFLWTFGLYALLNFGYYAIVAQVVKDTINRNGGNPEGCIALQAEKMYPLKLFFGFKRGWKEDLEKHRSLFFLRNRMYWIMISLYTLLVGFLPFLAVNGHPEFILLVLGTMIVIYFIRRKKKTSKLTVAKKEPSTQ